MEIDLKDLTKINMDLRFSFDNRFVYFQTCNLSNEKKFMKDMWEMSKKVQHASTLKPLSSITHFKEVIVDRKTEKILKVENIITHENKFLSFGKNENIFYQSGVEDDYYFENNFSELQMYKVTLPEFKKEFLRKIEKGKYYHSSVMKFFDFAPDEESFGWTFTYSNILMSPPIIRFFNYTFYAFLAKINLLDWFSKTFDKEEEKEENTDEKFMVFYKDNAPITELLPEFIDFYWINEEKIIYSYDKQIYLWNFRNEKKVKVNLAKCECIAKIFPDNFALLYFSNKQKDDSYPQCNTAIYDTEKETVIKRFPKDKKQIEYYCNKFTIYTESIRAEDNLSEKVIYEKRDNITDETIETLAIERETNQVTTFEDFNIHKPDRNEHVYIISKFDPIEFKEKQLLKIRIINEKKFEVLDTYYDTSG